MIAGGVGAGALAGAGAYAMYNQDDHQIYEPMHDHEEDEDQYGPEQDDLD